jgi:hypothetical protein
MITEEKKYITKTKGLTSQRENAIIVNSPQLEFLDDIDKWVVANCKGPHVRMGREYIFNNEQDTMMFILRWS